MLLAAPALVSAQARRVSAPTGDLLFEITRGWGRASPLGDLQAARMGSGDVELRVWEGYGVDGTRGLVLRKTAFGWAAWRTAVHYCELVLPHDVGDTLSRASLERYQREARRRCGEPRTAGGGVVVSADTLEVVPLDSVGDLGALWEDAVSAGLLQLPPRVSRRSDAVGEHTYVVEVRRGNDYRASVIEQVSPPETDADRRVQRIDSLLTARLKREP